MDKWIYVGVFLDEKSKEKLKRIYNIPEGWTEYFDHMTVVYNDGSEQAKSVKSICDTILGKQFKLQVSGTGISDKAFAVSVNVPAGLPTNNKINHITLATSPTGKPVDSNYIENWNKLSKDNLYVTGILKVFKSN